MAAVYFDIMTKIKDAIVGLSLAGLAEANVKVRKLPKVGETLDTLPCVLVAPGDTPERIEQFSFEDDAGVSVTYPVDIAIVAAGNRDFSSNMDLYLTWRQSIRRLFQSDAVPGISGVFNVEILPEPAFSRALLNQNYDYSGMSIEVTAVEQRGN